MKDRAIFVCHCKGTNYTPGTLVDARIEEALQLLPVAARRMYKKEPSFSAARLCGVFHELLPGHVNLRLLPPPRVEGGGRIDWKDYGQGEAEVILIDVDTGKVKCVGGSLAGVSIGPLVLRDSQPRPRPNLDSNEESSPTTIPFPIEGA